MNCISEVDNAKLGLVMKVVKQTIIDDLFSIMNFVRGAFTASACLGKNAAVNEAKHPG